MIQIGFSTGESLISKAIRYLTKGKFSHAFITYQDSVIESRMIMEAQWDGFHIKKWSHSPSVQEKYLLMTPKYDITGLPKACAEFLGNPYDYTGILGAIPVMILRFFRIKSRNLLEDGRAKFCSEAIALGLQKINYPNAEKLDAAQTTPQDLYEFFKREK